MKKYIIPIIFLAGLSNIANAGDAISDEEEARLKPFCTKISRHAHTIMVFSFDRKRTKNEVAQSLNQSSAQPYWSNETKQWFKNILDLAYKNSGVAPTINALTMLKLISQVRTMLLMNFRKLYMKTVFIQQWKVILTVVKKPLKIVRMQVFHEIIEQN